MPFDADQVDKPVRKIRKLLKKMSSDPTPEQVHDLRTNARKLEAILHAVSLDETTNGEKVLKGVVTLRKRAGKVRDMDVLTEYATELPHEDGERECFVQLLEHLGAERHKHAKRLRRAARQSSSELRKRLKQCGKQLRKLIASDGAPSEAGPGATSSVMRMLSELSQPAPLTQENLHPYRIKVKELQNVLRMAEANSGQNFVQQLGEVKDAIGEWHDWGELLAMASEILEHGSGCGMIKTIRKNTDEHFQRALEVTEKMRRSCLRASDKKNGKQARPGPQPANEVWSATSALAA